MCNITNASELLEALSKLLAESDEACSIRELNKKPQHYVVVVSDYHFIASLYVGNVKKIKEATIASEYCVCHYQV